MKKFIVLVCLIIVAVFLSLQTAGWAGGVYSELFPGSVGGGWIGANDAWNSITGLPFALIFFLTLLTYKTFFQSYKSVLWLLSPVLLFLIASDLRHVYIPVCLILLALALNTFARFVVSKFKRSKLPVV